MSNLNASVFHFHSQPVRLQQLGYIVDGAENGNTHMLFETWKLGTMTGWDSQTGCWNLEPFWQFGNGSFLKLDKHQGDMCSGDLCRWRQERQQTFFTIWKGNVIHPSIQKVKDCSLTNEPAAKLTNISAVWPHLWLWLKRSCCEYVSFINSDLLAINAVFKELAVESIVAEQKK